MLGGWKKLLLLLLGSLALSFALYGYSLKGGFVRDDLLYAQQPQLYSAAYLPHIWTQAYVAANPTIGVYRPLSLMTLSLNMVFFGVSTLSFHLVNILVNGLIIWLVFLVVNSLFADETLAGLSALLFAFMPIHVEAVAFIKSRDELLATLFGLLAWLIFIKATSKPKVNNWLVWLSGLVFTLSVLSKETLFILPVLYFSVWWLQKRPHIKTMLKAAIPYVAFSLGYMWVRFKVLGSYAFGSDTSTFVINPLRTANFTTKFSTGLKILFLLFGKVIIPLKLSATYNFNHIKLISSPFSSWQAMGGLLVLLIALVILVKDRTKHRLFAVVILASIIPYLMVSKFVFSGGELAAERWIYFPSVGIAILLGYLITKLIKRKAWMGLTLFGLVLLVGGLLTVKQTLVWYNEKTLADSMISVAPDSAVSYLTLSAWQSDNGDYEVAEQSALKALSIYSKDPQALYALGEIEYNRQNYKNSEHYLLTSINDQNDTTDLPTLVALCKTFAKEVRYQDSLRCIGDAARKFPNDPRVEFILAVDYYKLGELSVARQHWDWGVDYKLGRPLTDSEKNQTLRDF